MEQTLPRLDRFAQAVLDTLTAQACVLNGRGTVVAANRPWRELTQLAGAPGLGADYLQSCGDVAGPYGQAGPAVAAGVRAVLNGEAESFARECVWHGPGVRRWYLVRAARVGDGPHVVLTHEDVTARRLAEEALAENSARTRAILDTAVDGILTIDQNGIIQTINPAAERMFGHTAADLIGRNVSLLMPAPHREEHDAYIARYLETGEKRIIGIGREVLALKKDGTTFPVELSVAEVRRDDWRVFVGTIRDITERKRREEALREGKDELERALARLQATNEEVRAMTQQLWQAAKLASVGELAASIAHELNNPLATVSLRVESALSRTPPDDRRRRALEIVQQETQRMAHLVANLLQFCRRGREEVSTMDVRQELSSAVDLVHHHLRKRQITVVQEFATDTPTIFADRQKLRQVFLNLLTNASDAMPPGGALTLRTSSDRLEGGGAGVRIEVTDTGVGITPEALPRVMEPFFTTKDEGKGTGLGLAICRRVVQEHQGKIDIASEVGRGTTVRIVLPIRLGSNVSRLRSGIRDDDEAARG